MTEISQMFFKFFKLIFNNLYKFEQFLVAGD